MLSDVLAEDLDEEIRASIGDAWLSSKVRSGGYENPDLDDLGDFVQIADRVLQGGECVECALSCTSDGGCLIHCGGDDPSCDEFALADWDLS